MTARQSTKSLPWLIGVLVVAALAALYVNVRGGGGGTRVSSPPLAQSGAVHTAAPAAVQTAASQQTAGTTPARGGSTQGTTTPSTAASATPAIPTGATGRADPFVPLAVERPAGSAPQIGTSTPGSGTGLGLPLPPGAGGVGMAPASPGVGMTVTGIVGNQPRVAIIQSAGQTFVVGVGENVNGAVVVSIQPEKVVLKRDGVTFELPLGGV